MRYIEWSETSCKALGISPEVGQRASMSTFYARMHPDTIPEIVLAPQNAIADSSFEYTFNVTNKMNDGRGESSWARIVGKALPASDGKGRIIVGAFRDVTADMNGYEATRAIRELGDPEKARIPIVAMTANAFEEDRREALRSGMNDHLAKSVSVSELMRVFASVLVER